MAHILGTSQAWQQVVNLLTVRNLSAESISELKTLLKKKEADYKKRSDEETVRFENELKQLIEKLEVQSSNLQMNLAEIDRYFALEIEFRELGIAFLQTQTWIFQRLKNRAKIDRHKRDIKHLKYKQVKSKDFLLSAISKLRSAIEYRQTHRDAIITSSCSSILQDIELLKHTISSPEAAGADAELEIIERLKMLPENCYVISGITLVRDKAKKFDGQWLKTAQIDHLVISPAGVFVIEAKNWSKEFSEQGNYFDPYQQVKRANYLCYEILRSPVIDVKVRSIIAHRGGIPAKPKESHVKVLHINEVNNYILWFKDKILNDSQIRELISCLRIWSKNGF